MAIANAEIDSMRTIADTRTAVIIARPVSSCDRILVISPSSGHPDGIDEHGFALDWFLIARELSIRTVFDATLLESEFTRSETLTRREPYDVELSRLNGALVLTIPVAIVCQ
jgi:hypothetical protein